MNKDNWKNKLSEKEYSVMWEKGTEVPFTGEYLNTNKKGTYACKVCGNILFSSESKFDTQVPGLMGWPSFEDALPGAVKFIPDDSHGMHRTEVVCTKCGVHLGHLFEDDSETKTGKHYCINSVCLDLKEE